MLSAGHWPVKKRLLQRFFDTEFCPERQKRPRSLGRAFDLFRREVRLRDQLGDQLAAKLGELLVAASVEVSEFVIVQAE
jgi:hypothetical protein